MIPWGLVLRIVGPLLLVGVIWLHGHSVGQAGEQRKAQAELNKALIQARNRELQWQQDAQTITEVHQDELQNIRAAAERAVAGLRDRPTSRLPAASACSGDGAATGAQLSKPDGEFLVGLAAEADRLLADLKACRSWIEAVTK